MDRLQQAGDAARPDRRLRPRGPGHQHFLQPPRAVLADKGAQDLSRLLLSPMPHARVRGIDTRAALAMPGVKAILTADDVPGPKDQVNDAGQTIKANPKSEKALTNEPLYQGEPVLAVAATDALTAAEAIEKIKVKWEPLPFNVDPVATLLPGAQDARVEGNIWIRPAAKPGEPPKGQASPAPGSSPPKG